ncbi:myosin-11-like [Labrus mixtus]|uniref:myosin-11-like n=1 Tax=Labrus mixtus TaxID=508554 RepID=UPI0029C0EA9F|nr:myosin-11-like [Labrus mixtus]
MTLNTQLQNNNLLVFSKNKSDGLISKRQELQNRLDYLIVRNPTENELIAKATDVQKKLRNLNQEKQTPDQAESVTITQLKKQLKDKEEEHSRDQAEIQSLKNQLNHTADQCSNEQNVKDLQKQLDTKIEDLQSNSNSVTSLALQVSTLTLQVEELKRQLQNTESQSKIAEIQKSISVKTVELAKKKEALKERSAQPQRFLQIITIQMEIEKLANVAVDDSVYLKINALQEQMNSLIEGIQDENGENTKLMFQLMAQKDEIERLRKQEETHAQAELKKIKDLENELEGVRNQIKEKTWLLDSSGTRIANLSAQIMELQTKIEPLEDEILYIKEMNAENLEEIQKRLNRTKMQMQDSELQLKEANANNYKQIMEIADLKADLKKAQKQASIAAKKDINKLEQQMQKQQRENQKLESQNEELKKQLKDKEEEHSRDQAEIQSLKNQLNHTADQCSNEQNVKDLQKQLDTKIEDLQSNSNSVTSLALQVSTLTLQVEELKRQLQNTESQSKIAEIQKSISVKTVELAKKKEALKERSAQPQRFLQIITIQMEIEKLANVAVDDSVYLKINALQEQMNSLIEGIQDENGENTKLMFQLMAQKDEIERLRKQEETHAQAELKKIKDLENELEGVRNQIKEKTWLLDSSGTRIANLSAQIMELQTKIEPLEDEILYIKEMNAENLEEIQKRLNRTKMQMQDSELQLKEANANNYKQIMEIADLKADLKKAQKQASIAAKKDINKLEQQMQKQQRENQKLESQNEELKKQLKDKEEEHSRDQAEIQSLKNQLNHTADQCSNEQNVKDLQKQLDTKIEDLQSNSNSVTSLALQVSTLTLQVEELKRQLQNTESQSKIAEIQKLISVKTVELAKKKEALKERSAQSQRFLQIITIQMEIEKLANVAVDDSVYLKINALQEQMNSLIEGIQDENGENTKLMFQLMAQKDEIERLRKQEETHAQAELKKIKDLENELEGVRNQIKEKTWLLDSSGTRIANLSAQIMELHTKIEPLQDEILYIKETNAENLEEIQKRLNRTKMQMQDSELQLKEANANNYKQIMEIADLRADLKKAQKQASIAAKKDINKLEQQMQKQQRENQKLESQNKDLQWEVEELKTCCSDGDTLCDGVQRKLEQCQQDADRLQLLLGEKDANIVELGKDVEEQIRNNQLLQNETSELREQQLIQARAAELQQQQQQQQHEKEARLNQLQQQLEMQTREYNELQDKYNSKFKPLGEPSSESVEILADRLVTINEGLNFVFLD